VRRETHDASRAVGRPPATTHAAIERAAFALIERRGFNATTMDDIALEVGVGRRTLFRYYASKNDILWGQFDQSLDRFAATFRDFPAGLSIGVAIRNAVVEFNRLEDAAIPQHRQRMRLLLGTPQLLAHSELRYAAWRAVVADFVAGRTGDDRDGLIPVLAGRTALAVALTGYEQWLAREDGPALEELLTTAGEGLATLFS
jgi:mycofactocin system transcriptional regulator